MKYLLVVWWFELITDSPVSYDLQSLHWRPRRQWGLAIHVPKLQWQSGASDCGVFAIAFAYHVARWDDVGDMEFDQGKMRSHLSNCFSNKKLLPFPSLNVTFPTSHLLYIAIARCQQHMEIWYSVTTAMSGTTWSVSELSHLVRLLKNGFAKTVFLNST